MKIEQLITMANQLGAFFETEACREEAMGDIANHLRKFWEPRMRRQIIQYVEQEDGVGLIAIVCDAIRLHGVGLNGGSQAIMADQRWLGESGSSDAG